MTNRKLVSRVLCDVMYGTIITPKDEAEAQAYMALVQVASAVGPDPVLMETAMREALGLQTASLSGPAAQRVARAATDAPVTYEKVKVNQSQQERITDPDVELLIEPRIGLRSLSLPVLESLAAEVAAAVTWHKEHAASVVGQVATRMAASATPSFIPPTVPTAAERRLHLIPGNGKPEKPTIVTTTTASATAKRKQAAVTRNTLMKEAAPTVAVVAKTPAELARAAALASLPANLRAVLASR